MNRQEILRLVAHRQISPQEGAKRIQALRAPSTGEPRPLSETPLSETPLFGTPRERVQETDVAVIGMAGRFPGAPNLDAYWHNLQAGICSITEIPQERWDVARFYDPSPHVPAKSYSKWGGFLDNVDHFDPLFFNISPVEARVMDPQQRLVLQEAYHALEDAGYGQPTATRRACGLYVGLMDGNEYHNQLPQTEIVAQAMMGNAGSMLAGRVAYAFDLQGPVITVDTACSSSLVAVDRACKSLINRETEMMLAGGVTLYLTEAPYIEMSKAQMLSADGVCKTFDTRADGFVPGEGVGFVVLKLLSRALADGDQIYGVIKGSGVNQDGKTNGLTAPNARAQRELQLQVYQTAGIDPRTITYVEAHGTGTKLGDPVEVEALTESFRAYTDDRQYCALGSVKTNIGHTSAAAGVAGLIKVLLSLKHQQLPPSLHFAQPNEHIDFAESPFYVNTELRDWDITNGPRCAAISSFGFSGTNAHLVVEEYRDGRRETGDERQETGDLQIVVLSARSEERLQVQVAQMVAFLARSVIDRDNSRDYRNEHALTLADLAYTLQVGREAMEWRLALVVSTVEELLEQLQRYQRQPATVTGIYQGTVAVENAPASPAQWQHEIITETFANATSQELGVLAQHWVSGAEINWMVFYGQEKPQRISLPTYPFVQKRYWFDDNGRSKHSNQLQPTDDKLVLPAASENGLPIPNANGGEPDTKVLLRSTDVATLEPVVTEETNSKATERVPAQKRRSTPPAIPATSNGAAQDRAAIEQQLRQQLLDLLYLNPDGTGIDDTLPSEIGQKKFLDLGLDSILGVEWIRRINRHFGVNIPATKLYDYPTLQQLAGYLAEVLPQERSDPQTAEQARDQSGDLSITPANDVANSGSLTHPKEAVDEQYGLVLTTVQAVGDSHLRAWQVPPPKADEIQIEVKASAINFPDILCIQGLYPTLPNYPFVPGFEVAGIVIAVGSTVEHVAVGDAVMALTGQPLGGHAHAVNVPGFAAVKKPTKLSFEEAASLPVIFLTVYHALELANVQTGDHILIQTAAGGCGLMAVQLVNLRGAVTYGTSSRDEKRAFLKQIGVDYQLDYTEDFGAEIRAMTDQRGVDIVVNMLAGSAIQKGLNVLAPGGRYVELAVHGLKTSTNLDLSRLVQNQSFYSIDGRQDGFGDPIRFANYLQQMVNLIEADAICPVVHRIYPLSQIQHALRYVESGAHIGKVVISHSQTEVVDLTKQCRQGLVAQKARSQHHRSAQSSTVETIVVRPPQPNNGIAIIGMAGRFPGANDVDTFWQNLANGIDSIQEIPPERWDANHYYDPDPRTPGKSTSRWLGALDEIDHFDARFFEISPREAKVMDPQQRLFLEEAWKALEDAGYAGQSLSARKCGIYVGAGTGDYHAVHNQDYAASDAYTLMGTSPSILAARLAYILDLKGASLTIDTACSSSLVAIHEGCQSLLTGQNEMVLAGGVSLLTTPQMHIMTSKAQMLAGDGRCKTFDNRADGFGIAEGVGVVVLKRLADAERDGDHIYGVIRGSAINQDGATNGITAPSVLAQTELELDVYRQSGIDPATIQLVEAHGTGTKLGDPIEIEALTTAFRHYTDQRSYCAIGSVKTNIGHTLTAAGVASVIKVLLALKHQQLPPSLHFEQPNEHIDFNDTPFYVNTEQREWVATTSPRRAAVSSFGFSGTNAHLVLEEYPSASSATNIARGNEPQLIVLSARNEEQLRAYVQKLLVFLEQVPQTQPMPSLASIAYTLQVGRQAMKQRLAFVEHDLVEMQQKLANFLVHKTQHVYHGQLQPDQARRKLLTEGEEASAFVAALIRSGKVEQLAQLWVEGIDLDWQLYHGADRPIRVSLPTYPFARKRFWHDEQPVPENAQRTLSVDETLLPKRLLAASTPSDQVLTSDNQKVVLAALTGQSTSQPTESSEIAPRLSLSSTVPAPTDEVERSPLQLAQPGVAPSVEGRVPDRAKIEQQLLQQLVDLLYVDPDEIDRRETFLELGLDSITGVEWIRQINDAFGLDINATRLYDYPTLQRLSAHLAESMPQDATAAPPTAKTPPPMPSPDIADEDDCEAGVEVQFTPLSIDSSPTDSTQRQMFHHAPLPVRTQIREQVTESNPLTQDGIAVIGMAGRFPGAPDVDTFWQNIANGVDSIAKIPPERWDVTDFYDPNSDAPGKSTSKWLGALENIDHFDPLFFGISPREAQQMDPQQRLFLQEAWKALEDAGYAGHALAETQCGIFVGVAAGDYHATTTEHLTALDAYSLLGNSASILAARLAYSLNLKGASLAIDTACSSSLVAIHEGCQSLLTEENEMVVAGGVYIVTGPQMHIMTSKAQMLAGDGRCKPFDNRADGFGIGEGVGVVVLKRLDDAVRDGDQIYGVIKGSAINQDGATNGITAPSANAQIALEEKVYQQSGIDPATIQLMEAHGTGTKLGDPIEVEALATVFRQYTDRSGYCAIGSVKSNIGHTLTAAGVAGLIKILLALKHQQLPPSLHFDTPNALIDFANSPFYVNTSLKDWQIAQSPRRAAVSSFGFSGTNAHLVIEEYENGGQETEDRGQETGDSHLLVLSARDDERLRVYVAQLLAFLENPVHSTYTLAAIAYTLQVGRVAMESRLAFVANTVEDLQQKLNDYLHNKTDAIYQGQLDGKGKPFDLLIGESETAEILHLLMQRGNLAKLAQLWVNGFDIDWRFLYGTETPRRVSLPTYPFAQERYWANQQPFSQRAAPLLTQVQQGSRNSGKLVLKTTGATGASLPEEDDHKPPVRSARSQPGSRQSVASTNGMAQQVTAASESKRLPAVAIQQQLMELLTATLYLTGTVDDDKPFNELGMDSITGVEFVKAIEQTFAVKLKIGKLYDYPTVQSLAAYITTLTDISTLTEKVDQQVIMPTSDNGDPSTPTGNETLAAAEQPEKPSPATPRQTFNDPAIEGTDVAVIGMAGRFPGAADLETYWHNLQAGICSITEIPSDRWEIDRFYDPNPHTPTKSISKWGGFLSDIDRFDPLVFNISPAEAELMDPQQRLVLETAYHALENAGYGQRSPARRTCGLYVGVMGVNEYYHQLTQAQTTQAMLGNSGSILAGRVAYAFDLQGPTVTVDTACSSSLVAVDMACKSLIHQDATMMLAGGVTLYLTEQPYIEMSKAHMLAPDGLCKTFDQQADGFVPGEGVGFVVLKLLHQAIADGDTIYGVIKGSSVNQDGRTNGLTAPNVRSQRDLQLAVYQKYGIDPSKITYVEAHGTGTKLGDPIEVEALTEAFQHYAVANQACALGSVKTNIGHTSAAAGIASLVKVLLALQHQQLPPSLHFDQPNEHIDFANSPFYVNRERKAWQVASGPRLAAINSFGFSGTNAHLVLEEYRDGRRETGDRRQKTGDSHVIVLSAKNEERLHAYVQRFLDYLHTDNDDSLAEMAYTLQVGREAMIERLAFVAQNIDEVEQGFRAYLEETKTMTLFRGNVERDQAEMTALIGGQVGQTMLAQSIEARDLNTLAYFWSKGTDIPWHQIYSPDKPQRVSLPTYPFARQRYWVDYGNAADLVFTKNGNKHAIVPPGSSGEAVHRPEDASAIIELDEINHKTITAYLINLLAQRLKIASDEVALDKDFQEYGVDSIVGMQILRCIEEKFDLQISGRELLEHGTVTALAGLLTAKLDAQSAEQTELTENDGQIRAEVAVTEYPLSAGQKGLWLLQKLSPEMSAYNVPLALRFQQPLDVERWREACEHLVAHYPILQTVIRDNEGEPCQVIDPTQQLSFVVEEVGQISEENLIAHLQHKVHTPFDLESGPLLRIQLFIHADGETILLLTAHHIIVDGTSMLRLLQGLLQIYQALDEGRDLAAMSPRVGSTTYQDFVLWEEEMLAGEAGQKQLAYWQQQLAGELPILALPLDKPRPPVQRYRGEAVATQLDTDLARQLQTLARSHSVNMATLMQAIFMVLLYRYTGQNDILIGVPSAGRPQRRFEETIGYFINMVVIRSQIDGEATFTEYLKGLQFIIVDALDHGSYPFSQLVADLKVKPDQAISPLYQVAFVFQNFIQQGMSTILGSDEFESDEEIALPCEILGEIHQIGEVDLGLEVVEIADSYLLTLEYNPDLFAAATIERMLAHYMRLAAAIVAAPELSLGMYELLLADEKAQILVEWNDTALEGKDDSSATCIHHLFEEQVVQRPTAVAVVFEEQQLTYHALNARANQLAHHLQSLDVGPRIAVGICMNRSIDLVTAVLGILKAGGTYIPMDPSYPQQRLVYMLQDAQAAILLTEAAFAPRFADSDTQVVCLEEIWPKIADDCSENLALDVPDNPVVSLETNHLAYIIYTSGSTGQPKGVMIEHQALVKHILAIKDVYGITQQERILQFSAFGFDAAHEQIFEALCHGATLILRGQDLWTAEEFNQRVTQHGVTLVELMPSYLQQLISQWRQERPSFLDGSLRLIQVSSEPIQPETVRQWQQLRPNTRLLNIYGPTEATVTATSFELTEYQPAIWPTQIPIGRPFPGRKAYILDDLLQPVPIGVAGKLYMGGDSLARGYLNQPELTAEKFIANPLAVPESGMPTSPEQLYDTGDLARWLPTGDIEFLGRSDYQVKVHGFRIELGEIEAVLVQHPRIQDAIVLVREDANNRTRQKHLVAYVTRDTIDTQDASAHSNGKLPELTAATLRTYLKQSLPDHMVPSVFTILDSLPLTPNGKIDREALATMSSIMSPASELSPPQTPVEEALADIWAELLGIDQVGRHDSFFEVGGDSLLCLQMISRTQTLGFNLQPQQIFEAQTIAELAHLLEGEAASITSANAQQVPISPGQDHSKQFPFFCVPGVGGNPLYLQQLAQHLGAERPFHALQTLGLDGISPPLPTVEAEAAYYIAEIRRIQPQGPYYLGGHSYGSWVAFEMAQQLLRLDESIGLVAILDEPAPGHFDIDLADDVAAMLYLADAAGEFAGQNHRLTAAQLQPLDEASRLQLLKTTLETLLAPMEMTMKQMRGFWNVFKTNNQSTYQPTDLQSLPLTFFAARENPRSGDPEAERQRMIASWAKYGPVTVQKVPGTHRTMLTEPHVQVLAQTLATCLESADNHAAREQPSCAV